MSETPHKRSAMMRLRNYFLTGFVVLAPLAVTAWLAWTFIGWVDGWVKPYIPARYNPDFYLPFPVPGFGLIVALVSITLIGFLTANFIGRSIVGFGERLLGQMPLVRSIYRGLKQIIETVLSDKSNTFKQVALVEYPRNGLWALVFIATEAQGEVKQILERESGDTVAVFLPTTPNPTSGFLLFVPRKDVHVLDMTVEEAAKLIISAGLVSPEYQAKTQQIAEDEGLVTPSGTPSEQTAERRKPAAE